MENCIFCKIIEGDIPSYKVYEDEHVYAFLDITQVTKGHTLVVPKKHLKDLFDYDDKDASEVFSRLPKIAKALEKAFPEMEGLNMVNNNKELAYQTVFHSHIHLIPRYSKEDQFSLSFGSVKNTRTPEEMANIAEAIAEQVSSHD